MPQKAKTPAKKPTVSMERSLVRRRRFQRTLLLIMIWAVVFVYAAGYLMVYQRHLRLTAPNVAARLHETFLSDQMADRVVCMLSGRFSPGAEPPVTELRVDSHSLLDVIAVLNNRADLWLTTLGIAMALSTLSSLGMHIAWRTRCSRVVSPAREAPAMRTLYQNLFAVTLAVHLLLAAVLFRISYQAQPGAGFAQLAYNGVFILSPLALLLSSRFAAPMCVSGRSCYFH